MTTDDGPAGLKRLTAELEANLRAVRSLPTLIPALQQLGELAPAVDRIAGFGHTLEEIARVVPALETLARLEETLGALANVAPALEQLAGLRGTLDDLAATLDPVKNLTTLTPTLESLAATIGELKGMIGVLSETLAPLQGTTQRLGRVMDRLGTRRGKDDDTP